jgi:hypothetical protein
MYFERLATCVSALALACGLMAVPVHAQNERARGCTNASLRGNFAFTARGTTLAALGLPPALTGAFSSSGTATFDGAGHFSLTATSSFNGNIQGPATVTGAYSVNSDCSYTSQASNGATFRAVIADNGRQLLILQTNPGTVIAGVAQKQQPISIGDIIDDLRPLQCSAAGIAGSYGFVAEGFAGAPALPGAPFGPLAGVGIVTLNADGTFMMMAQRSANGAIDPQPLPLSGKISVSSDCTAKLTFDVGFHFDASIVSRSEMVFIETDPGTALIVKSERL